MTKLKSRKSRRRIAREYAVQALYQWHVSRPNLNELLTEFVASHDFSGADQDYWHNLVSRILDQLEKIDAVISPCANRSMTDINPVELAILRLGICELLFSPEIPYRVVINEAVELAKTFAAVDSHRFINAAMDKVAKNHLPFH